MDTMNCPQCHNEIKKIPAGVSKKTQKPYNAFWPECKQCGYKPMTDGSDSDLVRPTKVEKTNWDAIGMAKAASQLYSACFQHGDSVVEAAEKVKYALEDINKIQQKGFESDIPF